MRQLPLGTIRNLQASSTPNGQFAIIAVDHRDALRALMNPLEPGSVSARELEDFKISIASILGPEASAVLLDPMYSAPQVIAMEKFPFNRAMLVALEEQGYLGDPFSRRTTLIEGWGVEKAKRMGANGVKVLLFYHPQGGEGTKAQLDFVQSIVAECDRFEIPLFLEPISYSPNPDIKKGTIEFSRLKPGIIMESAKQLSALGAHILKVEFPIDARYEKDHRIWEMACQELSGVCLSPWVLLSAGEPFEIFKEQLEIACKAGCSGFAVGRAVWQEAIPLQGHERIQFLHAIAIPRLKELFDITLANGNPWRKYYSSPQVHPDWYRTY